MSVNKIIACTIITLLTAGMVNAANIAGIPLDKMLIKPDSKTELIISLKDSGNLKMINCLICDYSGKKVAKSKLAIQNGKIILSVKLPVGYYEATFPELSNRTIGLMVQDKSTGTPDMFWGIDAAYSWFPQGATELSRMKYLKDAGISIVRERLSWKGIYSEPAINWNKGQAHRYLGVRQRLSSSGLQILDCFHDAPEASGAQSKSKSCRRYPANLNVMVKSWEQIFPELSKHVGEIEAWNEPDGGSGKGPAAGYVPLVKALAYARKASNAPTKIIGGVFSELALEGYKYNSGDNRMVDVIDGVSYHTYNDPMKVESDVTWFRNFLKKHGREGLPVLITEAGYPYNTSSGERPKMNKAVRIALCCTMRAIEARACGVTQYFSFIGQFYPEGVNNFSMIDKLGSAQRSLAAYCTAALHLRGMKYIGDLKIRDKRVTRARVFAGNEKVIAVVYTGTYNPRAEVNLSIPFTAAKGIDWRQIQGRGFRTLKIPDGLCYLEMDAKRVKHNFNQYITTNTTAMKLYKRSLKKYPPTTVSPLVLQPGFIQDELAYGMKRSSGYYVKDDKADNFHLKPVLFNLSKTNQVATVKIELPANVELKTKNASIKLDLTPQSIYALNYVLDLTKTYKNNYGANIKIVCLDAKGKAVEWLNIPLLKINNTKKSYEVRYFSSRWPSRSDWAKISKIELKQAGAGNSTDVYNVKAKFMWNEKGLFFRYLVHDSIHINEETPSNMWRQDSIQFGMSLGFCKDNRNVQYEYGIARQKKRSNWYCWICGIHKKNPLKMDPNSKLRTFRDESHKNTLYEGMISWNDFPPFKAAPGKTFAFTFCANNNNGDIRRECLEWTPGIATGAKESALFGKFILKK